MPAALITGASTGIGRELALLCARNGFDVVLVARSRPMLESLAAEIQTSTKQSATVFEVDLSKPEAAYSLFETVSRAGLTVDMLINNAGFGLLGHIWELDAKRQSQMVGLNVGALTDLTRLFLPGMIARRSGHILNIASTAAFQPGPLMAVYYATKAYVVSFSEAVHNEAKEFGVKVACLCPGPTKTEFAERAQMNSTKLFSSGMVMSAAEVAAIGYRGMIKGKPLVIAGRMNAVGAFLTRFAPLSLTAAMARKVQEG